MLSINIQRCRAVYVHTSTQFAPISCLNMGQQLACPMCDDQWCVRGPKLIGLLEARCVLSRDVGAAYMDGLTTHNNTYGTFQVSFDHLGGGWNRGERRVPNNPNANGHSTKTKNRAIYNAKSSNYCSSYCYLLICYSVNYIDIAIQMQYLLAVHEFFRLLLHHVSRPGQKL